MDLEYILSCLKKNASIGLPIICFSITKDKLYVTTKKIASRYFEHIDSETKFIEFRIKNRNLYNHIDSVNDIQFYDYSFEYFKDNSNIKLNEFLDILNIDNIEDITTNKISKNWHWIFVTRNPIIRLLSGFVELVDSMLSDISVIDNNEVVDIISKYMDISKKNNTQFTIKKFNRIDSDIILNYFSENAYNRIIEDEHTSSWNVFLYYFVNKFNGKFLVIDIDDKSDMQEYHSLSMDTTNNSVYKNWLDNHLNQPYIINFFKNLNQIMVQEYTNYIRLKSLK
jgi:hypothetical protein